MLADAASARKDGSGVSAEEHLRLVLQAWDEIDERIGVHPFGSPEFGGNPASLMIYGDAVFFVDEMREKVAAARKDTSTR
jgi:hypothetical protein